MINKINLWNEFCRDYNVAESGVPLFETQNRKVNVMPYGTNNRKVLKRSVEMDALVISEVEKVIRDFHDKTEVYDGLIYMMFWKDEDKVIPLYIGKSEKYGKNDGNLSANIMNIRNNKGNFCRWGYNYAYHIGNLSAVTCTGHPEEKKNRIYIKWANRLFKSAIEDSIELEKDTYFWMKAWKGEDIGPWKEFGPTSLTFLEYLLIGLVSSIFSDILLNEEGVNRS